MISCVRSIKLLDSAKRMDFVKIFVISRYYYRLTTIFINLERFLNYVIVFLLFLIIVIDITAYNSLFVIDYSYYISGIKQLLTRINPITP